MGRGGGIDEGCQEEEIRGESRLSKRLVSVPSLVLANKVESCEM